MSLSKELAQKIYEFLDGKVPLSDFEHWIYTNSNLEVELEKSEYLKLISFDFKAKGARYELCGLLERLLDKNLKFRNSLRSKTSIQGKCISNKGRYHFNTDSNSFDLTVGWYYDILSLSVDYGTDPKGNYCHYTIMDDKHSVFLAPAELFNLKLTNIPDDWVIDEYAIGCISLEPKEWNINYYQGKGSFWEDFHDDRDDTLIEFVRVLHKMNIEVPRKYLLYALRILCEEA